MLSNTNNLLTTGNRKATPPIYTPESMLLYRNVRELYFIPLQQRDCKSIPNKITKINSIARSTEQKGGIMLSKCLFPLCNIFSSGVNFVALERAGKRDY